MNTRGGVCCLAIAFGGAWTAWAIPILAGVKVTSPLFQLAALPGAFCPALAAYVTRRFVTREGFGDAGLALRASSWPYLLAAWLLPLIILAFKVVEAGVASIAHPDLSLLPALRGLVSGRRLPAHLPANLGMLVVPQLMITALVATPVLWGEEFGWRGYLQQRLSPNRPGHAALSTGVIWGLWHLPLIVLGYDFPGHPALSMTIFIGSTILLSVIFGWLFARTNSIWVPSLAHSATNAVGAGLSTLWFYGQADPILVSVLGILAWPPLVILAGWILATGQLRKANAL